MRNVDYLMEKDPLKHEIRVNFWSPYIKKLNKSPIKYLTLYSPPLMDVKYFNKIGLISSTSEKYEGVVGVTNDGKEYSASISTLKKRLEKLLRGDINKLLSSENDSRNEVKDLKESFPFDVINLDYTDVLHRLSLESDLSDHFQAIDEILRLQRRKQKTEFVLFITTNVKLNDYNTNFLFTLSKLFDDNIQNTPNFINRLIKKFQCRSAEEFQNKDERNYFSIAIVKFILQFLKRNNYSLSSGDINWIIRRNSSMLHLAFHIVDFVPPKEKVENY